MVVASAKRVPLGRMLVAMRVCLMASYSSRNLSTSSDSSALRRRRYDSRSASVLDASSAFPPAVNRSVRRMFGPRFETRNVIAAGFGDVDEVIAGLDPEKRGESRLLVQRGEIVAGDQSGAEVAARERQAIDRGAEIEAVLVSVEPPARQKAPDEAVDRALRCVEGAHQLRERHPWVVDDLLEDARDSIDSAVVPGRGLGSGGQGSPRRVRF